MLVGTRSVELSAAQSILSNDKEKKSDMQRPSGVGCAKSKQCWVESGA